MAGASINVMHFHPEGAPGQIEIVLPPLPPLAAVDTLLAAREIISEIADRSALRATFTPKPYEDELGTGAHIHMSVAPKEQSQHSWAGVLKHLPAITAFTLPNSASYERATDSIFSGGTWACWDTQNRETPLRQIEGSHYEIRCADGLANMYLSLAAIISAGMQGIEDDEVVSTKDCQQDPASLSEKDRMGLGICRKLPSSIGEALKCMHEDEELPHLLDREMVELYIAVKGAENDFLESIPPWERKDFLIGRY